MKKIYKKKIYENLGAVWFQKFVFIIENLKFKFIDKFCPNISDWYSKKCDQKVAKLCLKTDDEEKRKRIRINYNYKKMYFKKEIVERKNRNYHITLNNANSFYNYLLWNKKVHLKGIIRNLISILGCSIILILSTNLLSSVALFYLIYSIIALGINFECVNLQNYNIYRFNEKKEILVKLENRQKEKDIKNYALAGKVIYKQLEEKIERPKNEEIVTNLKTKEELEQLRKLALEIKNQRSKSNEEKVNNNKKRIKR